MADCYKLMDILHVVGARPNLIEAAPVMAALEEYDDVSQALIHTGQHYDGNMSRVFSDQLGLPQPDINLEVGWGSHAQKTDLPPNLWTQEMSINWNGDK